MRPSKSAEGAGRDRRDIAAEPNRLMAAEPEACLRYLQMRLRPRRDACAGAAPLFGHAITAPLEHADSIAQQMRALGHIPALRINLSLDDGPMRLETALAEALDVEQQALDAYKEFLPRVAGDPVLEEFIRRQVEVETEHVKEIRDFVHARGTVKLVSKPKAGT